MKLCFLSGRTGEFSDDVENPAKPFSDTVDNGDMWILVQGTVSGVHDFNFKNYRNFNDIMGGSSELVQTGIMIQEESSSPE